jgi:hypothetical protein
MMMVKVVKKKITIVNFMQRSLDLDYEEQSLNWLLLLFSCANAYKSCPSNLGAVGDGKMKKLVQESSKVSFLLKFKCLLC